MSADLDLCTPEEIERVTGRKRPSAQMRVLNDMGIDHVRRPDGRLLVHRDAIRRLLGITQGRTMKTAAEPDWEALDGTAKT